MQTIVTGSTRERIIRNGLVTLMFLGYSGWSFYDGFVGYPTDNLSYARGELPAESQEGATISPQISGASLQRLEKGESITSVEEKLGPAAWKGTDSDSANKAIWFGPGGTLVVRYTAAGVVLRKPIWKPGKHTDKDLAIQKIMGIGVGALGLIGLVRMIAMLVLRVRLSDAGLTIPGGRTIAFEAMSGWDAADFADKGRIRLSYQWNGSEKTFVLDDYKMAAFRPIVEEICVRKGFTNPCNPADQPPVAATESPPVGD